MKRQDANLEGCRHLGNISRLPGKKKKERICWQHIQEIHFAISLGFIKFLFARQTLIKLEPKR